MWDEEEKTEMRIASGQPSEGKAVSSVLWEED